MDRHRAEGIWASIAFIWFISAVLLAFVIGGLALIAPLPFVKEWLKGVTFYDLVRGPGFWYAVIMAVIGATAFLAVEEDTIANQISLAGVVILVLLAVGAFF